MKKIRIGKDIKIEWQLTASDPTIELSNENVTLEMQSPSRVSTILESTYNNGILSANIYGTTQTQLGSYWLTAWYKKGEIGQSMLDKVQAFSLVQYTDLEDDDDDSIAYAAVELEGRISVNNSNSYDNTFNDVIYDDNGTLKLHTTDDYSVNITKIYTEQDPYTLDTFYDSQFVADSCLATGALIHQIIDAKIGTINTALSNILG